ncbi:hypothetical protein SAMN05443575_4007 [Jatrophihabitans endophyticus]|uniref:DUF6318 domain-containing protein n=1 Tax=Jatrophihabitans endophyticus TaxID=1206085 RepID=A0A1M5TRA8_9ACTN|nr:DUF6318 family protein [Jatrophihabitans endophyticus]SHH52933.1 hypothetical protein SAMN05443575_4007 [Jatrophihabitans endophyticus]
MLGVNRRRFAAIVAMALVVLSAAACTSDDGSDPTPSRTVTRTTPTAPTTTTRPSSSATPSPTVPTTGPNVRPGEKPPTESALAKTHTPPGATEFALFWFQALDWGYATTDTTLTTGRYLTPCSTCTDFVNDIDTARRRHQHFQGGRIALHGRKLVANDNRHPGSTVVDVYFDSAAVKTLDSTGRVVSRGGASRNLRWRLWLGWTADHWAVRDMRRVITK